MGGYCPKKCPALCEDKPPQFPKCPLCKTQEECDVLHSGGLQDEEEEHFLPTCNDDTDRCKADEYCRASSMDYSTRLEAWFEQWYTDALDKGKDTSQMAPLADWEAGGEDFCACFTNSVNCISDFGCFVPTQEDIDNVKAMPFSFAEFCLNGMKCSADQCLDVGSIEEELFGNISSDPIESSGCAGHRECGDDSFCYTTKGVPNHCAPCEECHFDWDASDFVCPNKCPALCQDEPAQFGKCPLCQSQEECDQLHGSGFQKEEETPWPKCTDGTDRCLLGDECKGAMIDYAERMEEWVTEWFTNNPESKDFPPIKEWPDAGDMSCQCINVQSSCIIDNECYTDKDIEELEKLPFTLHEWCTDGMKCGDNCGWASWQEHGFCHDFMALTTKKVQRKFHTKMIQKEMKKKYHQKKNFNSAFQMVKYAAFKNALP